MVLSFEELIQNTSKELLQQTKNVITKYNVDNIASVISINEGGFLVVDGQVGECTRTYMAKNYIIGFAKETISTQLSEYLQSQPVYFCCFAHRSKKFVPMFSNFDSFPHKVINYKIPNTPPHYLQKQLRIEDYFQSKDEKNALKDCIGFIIASKTFCDNKAFETLQAFLFDFNKNL